MKFYICIIAEPSTSADIHLFDIASSSDKAGDEKSKTKWHSKLMSKKTP